MTIDPARANDDEATAFWDGVAAAERFFMAKSDVHAAMHKLCATLEADGIPYAIAGGMALNAYGYQRVTTDVAVLLTAAGLSEFKRRHLGLGWVERFPGSRSVRDTEHNVPIDVLITGGYPGDGKPKPVMFPDPSIATAAGGVSLLPLPVLVELKLASGMTNMDRLKDLADVQELIRHARLPIALADELHPMVRGKYEEIWRATSQGREEP